MPTHHVRACRFDARTHVVHIGQGVFDLSTGSIQIGLSLQHLGAKARLVYLGELLPRHHGRVKIRKEFLSVPDTCVPTCTMMTGLSVPVVEIYAVIALRSTFARRYLAPFCGLHKCSTLCHPASPRKARIPTIRVVHFHCLRTVARARGCSTPEGRAEGGALRVAGPAARPPFSIWRSTGFWARRLTSRLLSGASHHSRHERPMLNPSRNLMTGHGSSS